MKITMRPAGEAVVLDLQGTIDIDAAQFIETVGALLKVGSLDILCNFEAVEFADYMGLSAIAIACKDVMNHHGRFVLYNVPAHISQLFNAVGLNDSLEICATEEEALRKLEEDRVISEIVKKKLRRKFKRLSMRIPVEYKQRDVPGEEYFKGNVFNLSAIGAFVVGEKCFSLGDVLSARIFLSGRKEPLALDARVVWSADKRLKRNVLSGFGIEFYRITPAVQRLIIEFIDKNIANPL